MPFQPGVPANPEGKGGFGDNPEHRSNGRWKKENTFSYQLNRFKSMTVTEFEAWQNNTPKEARTIVEDLAASRIIAAQRDLAEFKEVADRSEGKPRQTIEIEADVNVNTISNQEVAGSLQKLLEASEITEGEVIPGVTTENTTQVTTEVTALQELPQTEANEPQWG